MDEKIRKKVVLYSVLVLVVCVTGWRYVERGQQTKHWNEVQQTESTGETSAGTEEIREETEASYCLVYVCGAVLVPGVYELPKDSRICHAVAAAGGLAGEADQQAVNLAAPLTDGSQIYIPFLGEETVDTAPHSGTDAGSASDGKLNLNMATKAQLMELPGIGEVRAEAILQYREASGGFSSIEEIMQVPGIKQALFERMKLQITV